MKMILVCGLGVAAMAIGSAGQQAGGGQPGRGGAPAEQRVTFKPLVANGVPARSCESLATVSLPDSHEKGTRHLCRKGASHF